MWCHAQIAYREAEALRRQDLLIAEEFELQKLEDIKRKEQAEREKEKKAKKKVGWLACLFFFALLSWVPGDAGSCLF